MALQLVTHNSSRFLPFLLESLQSQTDRDWRLFVFDAGSNAEELAKTRALVEALDLPATFEAGENIGFAGGHDELFFKHHADAVLLLNPDVILTPTYIATVRQAMERDDRVGAITGLIYRWEWDAAGAPTMTQTIDSFGMVRSRSQKVFDRTELTDKKAFGVSGCLPLYRRQAIEKSSPDGHLFDSSYFMYKEDVDAAYRLKRGGWETLCLPEAAAYHHRGFRASALHHGVSPAAQFLSYRNHWWNLFTHLTWRDWLRDGWAIVPFEIAKMIFFLFSQPSVLVQTWRETRREWPRLKQRRLW